MIEDAIAAAGCLLVLWTRASVGSEWVRSEASEGKRRGILVPILLDEVDPPLAFRLLNSANLTTWEAGSSHPELDTLTERIADILKQPATAPRVEVRGDRGIEPQGGVRRPRWLAAAVAILLVAGAVSGAYIAGTWRQGSKGDTPAGSGDNVADATESAASTAAVETPRLEDLFKPLGLGLGDAALPMRAFELQDLGLHLVFIRPEQADMFGLSPGAVFLRVEKGAAQAAGLQAGDVVAAINGRKISNENDLRNVVRSIGPGKSRYVIRRDKETLTLDIDCSTCTVS